MRRVGFVLVSFFLLIGCQKKEISTWEVIASDYESSLTPFIVVNITSASDSASIALQGYEIYNKFRDDLGFSAENYVPEMIRYLKGEIFIAVEESSFVKLSEYAISNSSYVDSVFAKGIDFALAHFFDGNLQLKKGLSRAEYYYLIKSLFDRGYFVTIAGFTAKLALYPKIAPFDSLASVMPDSITAPRVWVEPSNGRNRERQ